MLRHWKLAMAVVTAVTLVWGMRTGSTPNALYPIIAPKANPHSDKATPGQVFNVRGNVRWTGDRPLIKPLRRPNSPYYSLPDSNTPNPLAPVIASNGGVSDAFIVLEGPGVEQITWSLPPVRIEWAQFDCAVIQGDRRGRFGLVRAGDEAEFMATEAKVHSTRARGADFFTVMLPTINRSVRRVLDQPGLVEITSGSWFYWAQARLWVSPHGGCAITDGSGNFILSNVPPGRYDLLAIRPNWNIPELEGDPEFPIPVRAKFEPPVILRKTITVENSNSHPIQFEMNEKLFTKTGN